VRKSLERYRQVKETLEAISELNQHLLRLDRDESKERAARRLQRSFADGFITEDFAATLGRGGKEQKGPS
jgi:hypothetical protein